jgi:uncharacterized integral membrane protein (TIGR00698 family)
MVLMNESGDGGAANRPYQRRVGLKSDLLPRWFEVYRDYIVPLMPGVAFSVTLAMAATFISIGYGGPTVLFALLLGMAFNFLAVEPSFAPGLSLASRSILRVGVALLGARITSEQILALGWLALAGVTAAVAATILFGLFAARLTGMPQRFGVLTAGAVAICGASAAAAIAAVLPRGENLERDTAFTIIGVTTLSTVCMVLYPLLARVFHFNHAESGVFLGGTIHDVAQVVGAGYAVSPETGDVATIVKLLRVALLLPTVMVITIIGRRYFESTSSNRPPLVPIFLAAFIAIVILNSLHLIPQRVQTVMSDASRWCIVTAIAALGVKTSLAALAKLGGRAVGLMAAETIFIASFVLIIVHAG